MKAIIVDDEENSRENLKHLLARHCPAVEVAGMATNKEEARELLGQLQPDLVFLDIQMPDGSGFDLLNELDHHPFEVVFVTAHNEFAIKAFKFNVVDYILKPIKTEALVTAVNNALGRSQQARTFQHYKNLVEYAKGSAVKRLALPVGSGIEIREVNDIVRCQADDSYCKFFFTDKSSLLVTHNLGYYEELFSDFDFLRIHKSHMINMAYLRSYSKGENSEVTLTNGEVLPISKRRKADLIAHLGKL